MNKSNGFPLTDATNQMSQSSKGQISQGLLIQNYCNSVKEQPQISFGGQPHLAQYQFQINQALVGANAHADNYLNVVQPMIINNLSNMQNYFLLHQTIPLACPEGSTVALWIATLSAIQEQSQDYVALVKTTVTNITNLYKSLATDSAAFSTIVSNLNTAVNGDNGALASLESQVNTIQAQIDGAIAGTALSALAIVAGAFIAAVGGITDFVTAGASTPVLLGGIALVAAGVGGEAASAITLKNLNDEKANILQQEASLTAEVKLAKGVSTAYGSLQNQAGQAVTAATAMKNAWDVMESGLGNLIGDLQKGIQDPGALRTLYLAAANGILQQVIADITTIDGQMAGVTQLTAAPGETVGQLIVAAAKGAQAVRRAEFMRRARAARWVALT